VAEKAEELEAERKAALRQGKQPPKSNLDERVAAALPPPPRLEDEPAVPEETADSLDDADMPMYFQRPEQLLEIFSQLEESNLFLIQNCQDTEQQLEELKQEHAETAAEMARQSASLDASMSHLHAQLAAEEAKATALRRRIGETAAAAAVAAGGGASGWGGGAGSGAAGAVGGSGAVATGAASAAGAAGGVAASGAAGSGDSAFSMEAMLPQLRSHIVAVFERCGFKATASSDTISMLTQLEGKLESLITLLSGMDPEYVGLKEREKERDRRVRVREARLKAQQEAHELRLATMKARAEAPVKKREGKPVMFRSAPFEKRVVVAKADPSLLQEREDLKFWV